jgi:hypothetical protein
MLGINLLTTYLIRLGSHPAVFCARYKSTRFVLTAAFVCFFQFSFLGWFPEYWLDSEIFTLGREWYLLAGPVYAIYLGFSLLLYPLETLRVWASVTIYKK